MSIHRESRGAREGLAESHNDRTEANVPVGPEPSGEYRPSLILGVC
jgi:hypothetical protein